MLRESDRQVIRELNREQRRLASNGRWFLVGYIALSTAICAVADIWFYDTSSVDFLMAVTGWALGYVLLVGLMQGGDYFSKGRSGGIGTYFVICLVTGIAISLALVVLILPGLYLMMRWIPVYARALTNEDWIGNNLRWSWAATEPYQMALSVGMVGPVLCYGLAWLPFLAPAAFASVSFELEAVLVNLVLSIGIGWHTVLGIAALSVVVSGQAEGGSSARTQEPA